MQFVNSDTQSVDSSCTTETSVDLGIPDSPDQNRYNWESAGEHSHHTFLLPAVMSLIPSRKSLSVLDAGCGSGYLTMKVAELGNDVTGIDSSPNGIRLARLAYPGVRFEIGSIYDDLQKFAPPKGWDLIVAVEVIEHLFSPKRFLENMHRHLRPGGTLLLSTPYHGYLKNLAISLVDGWDRHHTVDWECGHIKFFSRRTLSALFASSGFREVRFRYAGRVPLLWKSMVCVASREH